MSADSSTAAALDGVELLERALSYTVGSLLLVTPELRSAPTPCARWDLTALLEHMNDSLEALCEALDLGRVSPRLVVAGGDPVVRLKERGCRLMAALSHADGRSVRLGGLPPLPQATVARTGALEVAVHGWDVARACGTTRPLPAGLALQLHDVARVVVTAADRPARFARPVDVPAGSGPTERLLGYLGRSPRGLVG